MIDGAEVVAPAAATADWTAHVGGEGPFRFARTAELYGFRPLDNRSVERVPELLATAEVVTTAW